MSSLSYFRFHTPDEERPFICKLCPRGFLNQCQLDDHVARAHEGRRPYPCRAQGCSRAFTLPGVRKRHEKRDHNLCINLKRGMRSRSEVNSGIHAQQPLATSFAETAAVCQVLPHPIHPVHVGDGFNVSCNRDLKQDPEAVLPPQQQISTHQLPISNTGITYTQLSNSTTVPTRSVPPNVIQSQANAINQSSTNFSLSCSVPMTIRSTSSVIIPISDSDQRNLKPELTET